MTASNQPVDLANEDGIAVVTVDSPPVNALSAAVRDGLGAAFEQAGADPDVKGIVLICAGRTFIAGADISEFGKPPRGIGLRDLLALIESTPKPVVAAIHGTALGGGLETALVCHYRLAVPSVKLGLPEVRLGLLPGAGGTQRLPRIVGAETALNMVTSGKPIGARAAADAGLVDTLVDEGALRPGAIDFARKIVAEAAPLPRIRDRTVSADPKLFADFRAANARRFRGFEAPEANIQCIEAAVNLPFEEGLDRELELFMKLISGTQSAAQRHIFFAERQAGKIADLPKDVKLRGIDQVGIIGAGTMGGGIAMNFLSAGVPVTIVEAKEDALRRGVATMRANYQRTAAKGRLSAEAVEANLARLTPSLDLAALSGCDLVIEAVFEDMGLKKAVFGKLGALAKPGAILASNTSYLDIDEIAAATSRPGDVLGMHFFSPANVMRLLEVVRGAETAPEVLATAMALARKIGKIAVVSGVCHGFIGNRMLAPRQQQAGALVLEGAMPWDVDRVLYEFGFPMGPFQMADLAGLDIGWSAETSKGETIRDRLCEAGKRGQKTGSGFYDYDEKRDFTPSALAEQIILGMSAERGVTRRKIGDPEILERCLYPMINEGAKILDEGIAQRASDIDVVWVYGYGFPVYRGGPMFYGDSIGPAHILEALKRFQARHGDDFTPSPLLTRLAASGGRFGELD